MTNDITSKAYKFEDFLRDLHMAKFYIGTDDDAPDAFNVWMENTTQDDLIGYVDEFANAIRNAYPH